MLHGTQLQYYRNELHVTLAELHKVFYMVIRYNITWGPSFGEVHHVK